MPLRPGLCVPLVPPRTPPAQTFTGRVIVRLKPAQVERIIASFPDERALSLDQISDAFDDRSLKDLLIDLGNPHTARLIHRWTVSETRMRERRDGPPSFRPLRSLNAYFSVDLPNRTLPGLVDAASRFRQLSQVDSAFVEPAVEPAAVTPDKHTYEVNFRRGQGYVFGDHARNSEESGVNATAVWGSYDGAGVSVVVLEEGWKQEHPDLPQPGGAPIPLLDANMINVEQWRYHGTSTLGVLAAVDDPITVDGIVGIAPRVTIPGLASFHYSTSSDWEIVEAIGAAVDVLGPGDILLLEVHTRSTEYVNGVKLPDGYPIEIADHWLDAIRLAVLHGITVIEPAGNPNGPAFDLDKAKWVPIGASARSLDPTDTTFIDSGAIMVGACESDPVATDLHNRLSDAWFGARIDCYAWGEHVLTTNCDGIDLTTNANTDTCHNGVVAARTYDYYNGTSSASAIIAGVAALVHQMLRLKLGVAASPARVRELLGTPSLGTPIGNIGSNVKSMPDLGLIAGTLNLLPEIYVRDSLADVGAVPSAVVSMSPDIFVLDTMINAANPGAPYNDPTQFIDNDLVVPNADNFVYVRISNLATGATATGCDAWVYWTPPATLLVPSDWNLIGHLPATVNVPAGGQVVGGPVVWHPTAAQLPYGGHGCFIAQVEHPTDPRPIPAPNSVTWDEFLALIGNSNNVAWKNFNVITAPAAIAPPASAWAGAGFEMRGRPDRPSRFSFMVRPTGFPTGTRVYWRMPEPALELIRATNDLDQMPRTAVPDGLIVLGLREDRPLRLHAVELEADARIAMAFGVFTPVPLTRPAHLEIRQYYRRVEIGRITWAFRTGA